MENDALTFNFDVHRQKEKKDAGPYQAGDALSSNGSVADQDSDLSTSSNHPLARSATDRSQLSGLLRPSTELYSALTSTSSLASSAHRHPTQALRRENDKENLPCNNATPSIVKPTASLDASTFRATRPLYDTDSRRHSANAVAPVVTQSKFTARQALGSHAPLARTPSLDHVFMFPPSPKKKAKSVNDADGLKAIVGKVSKAKKGEKGAAEKGLFSMTTSEHGRASVWVKELNKRENSYDAPLDQDFPSSASSSTVSTPVFHSAPATSTRPRHDSAQMWTHMESDPPSAPSPDASPVPLTRKTILSLAQAHHRHVPSLSEIASSVKSKPKGPARGGSLARLLNPVEPHAHHGMHPSSDDDGSCTSLTMISSKRQMIKRSLSLGGERTGASKDIYGHSRNEGSRAGGEETCAQIALGRKRARIIDEEEMEGGSKGKKVVKSIETVKQAHPRQDRRHSLRNQSSSPLPSPTSSQQSIASESESQCGELSFSSTTTTTSIASSSNPSSIGKEMKVVFPSVAIGGTITQFRTKGSRAAGEKVLFGSAEERECAELLLGLGGIF